jgi:hypothetical protein
VPLVGAGSYPVLSAHRKSIGAPPRRLWCPAHREDGAVAGVGSAALVFGMGGPAQTKKPVPRNGNGEKILLREERMRRTAFAMALAFCFGASTLRGQSAFGKGASLLSPAVQEKDRKPATSSPPTRAQGCETCECEARRRIAVMAVDVGNVSPEARSSFSWSPEKIQGEIIAVLSEKPRVSAMTPAEALPILAAATTPGVLAPGVSGRGSVEPQMAAQAQLFVRIGPVEISHNDVREVSPEVEATLREARELDQRSSSLFAEAKEENERAGYESRRAALTP